MRKMFWEVSINGRPYARFVEYDHAKQFADVVKGPGKDVQIGSVLRVHL